MRYTNRRILYCVWYIRSSLTSQIAHSFGSSLSQVTVCTIFSLLEPLPTIHWFVVCIWQFLQQRWRTVVMSTSVCISVCLSVCLSVREHISRTTRAIFTKFFVHVAYRRGSVLLQGKGVILGVFFPTENELYGQYSDMNFDTKDRFGLNLLLCRKVGHNSIAYY